MDNLDYGSPVLSGKVEDYSKDASFLHMFLLQVDLS